MKKILETFKIILLASIMTLSASYAYAEWSNPPSNPPTNNTPSPINVGSSDQVKEGSFGSTESVSATQFCLPINTDGTVTLDCIDKWPKSGSESGSESSLFDSIVYVDRVTNNMEALTGLGTTKTFDYPNSIPNDAKAVIISGRAYGGSYGKVAGYMSANNLKKRQFLYSFSPSNSDDSSGDMNTLMIPYSSDRKITIDAVNEGGVFSRRVYKVDFYFDGYIK